MPKGNNALPEDIRLRLAKGVLALVWLIILAVCLLHREDLTLERILTYTPAKPLLAAAVLLAFFAVKSLRVFLYSGILYIAAGILFPLPAAIAVNVLGTAVMVTLPYFLGRALGSRAVQDILRRWPKATSLVPIWVRWGRYTACISPRACWAFCPPACCFPSWGRASPTYTPPSFS